MNRGDTMSVFTYRRFAIQNEEGKYLYGLPVPKDLRIEGQYIPSFDHFGLHTMLFDTLEDANEFMCRFRLFGYGDLRKVAVDFAVSLKEFLPRNETQNENDLFENDLSVGNVLIGL